MKLSKTASVPASLLALSLAATEVTANDVSFNLVPTFQPYQAQVASVIHKAVPSSQPVYQHSDDALLPKTYVDIGALEPGPTETAQPMYVDVTPTYKSSADVSSRQPPAYATIYSDPSRIETRPMSESYNFDSDLSPVQVASISGSMEPVYGQPLVTQPAPPEATHTAESQIAEQPFVLGPIETQTAAEQTWTATEPQQQIASIAPETRTIMPKVIDSGVGPSSEENYTWTESTGHTSLKDRAVNHFTCVQKSAKKATCDNGMGTWVGENAIETAWHTIGAAVPQELWAQAHAGETVQTKPGTQIKFQLMNTLAQVEDQMKVIHEPSIRCLRSAASEDTRCLAGPRVEVDRIAFMPFTPMVNGETVSLLTRVGIHTFTVIDAVGMKVRSDQPLGACQSESGGHFWNNNGQYVGSLSGLDPVDGDIVFLNQGPNGFHAGLGPEYDYLEAANSSDYVGIRGPERVTRHNISHQHLVVGKSPRQDGTTFRCSRNYDMSIDDEVIQEIFIANGESTT